MARKLTPQQIAQYERDGYICPVDAFSADGRGAWHDKLEAFERAEGQKMTRGHNFKPHLCSPGSTRSCMRRKSSTRSRT